MGFYSEDENGNPLYNCSYIDQIYDGLLENGVRPFVELSFMREKLASTASRQLAVANPSTLELSLAPHSLALIEITRREGR